MESPDTVAIPIIDQGGLIPPEEESYNHTARVCAVNKADNKLYVSMGQPFNVAGPDKYPAYDQVGIGGIIRFNRFPGELDREVVAIGVRNSVGHAFNPKDGTLWFTDNQVDGMGDETPPGEINKACKLGSMFGMVTLTMVVVMLELMNIKDKIFQKHMLITIVSHKLKQ